MADDAKKGRIAGFNYSESDLVKKLEEYRAGVESGEIVSPSFASLWDYLGVTPDVISEVIRAGTEVKGAYCGRAEVLRRFFWFVRSELEHGQHWPPNTSRMRELALRQDPGDGVRYVDKPESTKGSKVNFVVTLDGGSKRGKNAGL